MRKTIIKKAAVGLAATAALSLGAFTAPAMADPPGPGSKQCAPGQHGNPQPGFKPGVCYKWGPGNSGHWGPGNSGHKWGPGNN
jgi:hypothetical protein